jgi:hypothetical protein
LRDAGEKLTDISIHLLSARSLVGSEAENRGCSKDGCNGKKGQNDPQAS